MSFIVLPMETPTTLADLLFCNHKVAQTEGIYLVDKNMKTSRCKRLHLGVSDQYDAEKIGLRLKQGEGKQAQGEVKRCWSPFLNPTFNFSKPF